MIRKIVPILLIFMEIQAIAQTEAFIVIAGGGKTEVEAQSAYWLLDKNTGIENEIQFESALMLSDTIKGLNPGFYIVIMGFVLEEQKAKLMVKIANKHLKGVYMKKVYISEALLKSTHRPVLKPVSNPFSTKELYYLNKGLTTIWNTPAQISTMNIPFLSPVFVSTDKPAFTRRQGSFDAEYFLAWFPSTKTVAYISEFQFSEKLGIEYLEQISECQEQRENYMMGEF